MTAWKAGGYRTLPELNIGCSGIRVAGSRDSWLELAGDDRRLRDGLERLHEVFKDADTLGSLIDPKKTVADDGLMAVEWDEIEPLLTKALHRETTTDPAASVFGNSAKAVAKAAALLANTYTLVATNPPFLGRQQVRILRGLHSAHRRMARLDWRLHARLHSWRSNGRRVVCLRLFLAIQSFADWAGFSRIPRMRFCAKLGAGRLTRSRARWSSVCS